LSNYRLEARDLSALKRSPSPSAGESSDNRFRSAIRKGPGKGRLDRFTAEDPWRRIPSVAITALIRARAAGQPSCGSPRMAPWPQVRPRARVADLNGSSFDGVRVNGSTAIHDVEMPSPTKLSERGSRVARRALRAPTRPAAEMNEAIAAPGRDIARHVKALGSRAGSHRPILPARIQSRAPSLPSRRP